MSEIEKMKVAELKEELKTRGLDITGKKADLVARLKDAMEQEDDDAEPEPEPVKKKAPAKRGAKRKAEPEEDDDDDEEPAPKAKKQATSSSSSSSSSKKEASSKPKAKPPVDKECPLANSGSVYEDYDVMLNQTNIGQNNNKYYVIQIVESGGGYYLWTHWGRVGESGQNGLDRCNNLDAAIKAFKKKFHDKTKNHWDNRENFTPVPKSYTIVEIDHSQEDSTPAPKAGPTAKSRSTAESKLDKQTQDLIKLIFSHDMFNNSMKEMEIDVEKMPLGKLTKAQVKKGHDALQEIGQELEKDRPSSAKLAELSSRFYTVIPHNFGRRVPPPINTAELLQKKIDLLNTLGDIEMAQSLLKEADKEEGDLKQELLHELDRNYAILKNELTLLEKESEEFKIIERYMKNTCGGYFKGHILDAWSLDRAGEKSRMDKHKTITYRKLLWHGTSVAVVVAILSSGLRIMPHSGGRVGRGIYHASEHSKSAGYTGRVDNNIGFMFLNEVALGKQYEILRDDPSLRVAPPGYDSVLAKGHVEPDPSKEVTIKGEWGDIIVPQGAPIKQKGCEGSTFTQSEYLVYEESQVRMKYLLKIKFN